MVAQEFTIELNEQGPQGAQGEQGETGATGNGINYISKTSTSGLTDTYTIYYTNGNTSTFEVNNGNGIVSIDLTSTSGVTDTYTITFEDGTTTTFDVVNGSSIATISKTATAGLVDTYTIILTNGSTTTFQVTNGSSISTIAKTSTVGLVDTYTITLTNGNTSTFTVTNGAKGDKGDTGNGVASIAKTSTSGLVDTYTITYTDSTTSTFTVTNGSGIVDIELLSTEGLTNNYRINFQNGTYFDYSLDNAKSIVSIAKTFTSGLVDTYTITFNDSTTFQFPVTNGNGVSGVTLLSWVGLDKTYRMTFTNGTYFDFTVSNGAEGQTEWGGINGVLSNQHDLQDALDLKADVSKTHALKSYSDNGELLQDADGLAFVKNYAHSTFDRSKFTVVGSPNITDDGIASGFSSSNYVKTTYSFSQQILTNFEIDGEFSLQSGFENFVLSCDSTNNKGVNIMVNSSGLTLYVASSDGTAWAHNSTVVSNLQANKTYIYKILLNNGNLTLDFAEKGSQYVNYPVLSNVTGIYFTGNMYLGYRGVNSSQYLQNGSIDLKQFSITVDGVPVFSGNKTGIDTIKPDDYTIPSGSNAVISADGIASGGTVVKGISIQTGQPFKIFGNVYLGELSNSYPVVVYCGIYDVGMRCMLHTHQFIVRFGTTEYWFNDVFRANSMNYYVIDFDGVSTLKVYSKFNINDEYVLKDTKTTTNVPNFDDVNKTYYYCSDIIRDNSECYTDLNLYKIYLGDELAYQPCLKIPYTESKTGSKIVNAIYRDRVNDMANQFGYANYYTLQDEPKGNYAVVGSPTISSDFVASGFSSSSYLTTNSVVELRTDSNIKIQIRNTLPSSLPSNHWLLSNGSIDVTRTFNSFINANTKYFTVLLNGEQYAFKLQQAIPLDKEYDFFITIKNSKIKLGWQEVGTSNLVESSEFDMPSGFLSSGALNIGSLSNNGSFHNYGSIDLKQFKIYVDNKLAYEAVIDPNFTLPQVELYGLIGQRTLRDSYRNGINYWELYSNRDLEQGGSCTSGVEVTFARPFADTNYVLSVPYSAKSATAFTPTQTGDWIAKGKGIL